MKYALRLGLMLVSLWALACGAEVNPLTQLIVEVDSNLSVPDQIDRLTVSVEHAQANEASADLTNAPLPRTLGLVHSAGPLGPVVLLVSAWRKDQKVLETSVSTAFEEGKTVHVSVKLQSACIDVTCAGDEICSDGVCQTIDAVSDAAVVDTDASAGTNDGGGSDAAAGSDASSMADAGSAAAPTCTIQQPALGDTFQSTVAFNVQGSCKSDTGMLVTQGLTWTSDLDGMVGRGTSAGVTLSSVGTHMLSLCAPGPSAADAPGCAAVTIAVAATAQPTATITSVIQGTTNRSPYQSGAPIVVSGMGSGTGVTLSWSDSLQGPLGTGLMATLQSPSVGKHTVTLTITDRSSRKSSATTTFVVLAPGQTTLMETVGGNSAVLNGATDLAERSAGIVYVAASDGRLYSVNAANSDPPQLAVDRPPLQGTVQDVLLDAANALLYLASTSGLTVCVYTEVTGPGCVTYAGGQLPSNNVRSVLRVPQSPAADRLLIGTEQGLLVADTPVGSSSGTVKANERSIRAMAGDRNVSWLATDQGLYRYGSAANTATRVSSGLTSNASWNTVALGSLGAVWLGGATGLARYVPGSDMWTTWRMADGLVGSTVSSIAIESQTVDGTPHEIVWIGTNAGVSRFDLQLGTFQSFTTADGLPSNSVTKVLVLSNGTKLFATDAGIARYNGG